MGSPVIVWVLTCWVASMLGIVLPWEARSRQDPLGREIAPIVSQDDGTKATRRALEARLLSLMRDYGSEDDKGIIFASIAHVYGQPRGHPDAREDTAEDAAKYAKLALKQPLDDLNVCGMYSVWGRAVSGHWPELPSDRFVAVRRKATVLYLLGLKYALDHGAPAQPQPVPNVNRYHVRGARDSPEVQAARQQYAREVQGHDEAVRMNELAGYRDLFIRQCVTLYAQPPSDPDELSAFSDEILLGHEEVASGMVRKLQWWQKNKDGWRGPFPSGTEIPPMTEPVGTEGQRP